MNKKQKKEVSAEVVLASIEKKIAPMIKKLHALEIEDQDDFERAGKLMKVVKEAMKEAEAKRRSITDKLNAVVKEVNSLFKPFMNKCKKLEEDTKQKMLEWHQEVEEVKQQVLEAYDEDKPIPSKLRDAPIDNSSRFSQTREVDEYIYDKKLIPLKFLIVDEPAVKAAIKAGKKVPGVKVRKKPVIAI